MSNSGNLTKMLAGKTVKDAVDSSNPHSDASQVRLLFTLLINLFFIGNDAVKIIFRKNYGVDIEALVRFIVLVICLFSFGIACMAYYNDKSFNYLANYAINYSNYSFIIIAYFYFALSAYILFKGVKNYRISAKRKIDPDDEGVSSLLSFLNTNYSRSEKSIQYFFEPFYILFLGGLVFFYNPIGAIPFSVCAISVWVFPLIKKLSPKKSKTTDNSQQNSTDFKPAK